MNNLNSRKFGLIARITLLFSIFAAGLSMGQDINAMYNPEKNDYNGHKDPGQFTNMKTMSEAINPANGVLNLIANDVTLPGRNGMNVIVDRVYNSNVWSDPGGLYRNNPICENNHYYGYNTDLTGIRSGQLIEPGLLGLGWDFHLGEIKMVMITNIPDGDPEWRGRIIDDYSWIALSDGVRHEIAPKYYYSAHIGSGYPDTFIVKDKPGWLLILRLDGHLKFTLIVENGVKYDFNRMFHQLFAEDMCLPQPGGIFERNRDVFTFWPTKIEDANGNYISICYRTPSHNPPEMCGPSWGDACDDDTIYVEDYRPITKIIDNMGRTIIFHISKDFIPETPDPGYSWRLHLDSIDYTGHNGCPVRIKYFYNKNFTVNYGSCYSDINYGDIFPSHHTIVLDSVVYYHYQTGSPIKITPRTWFEYDHDFGVLRTIHYPNGGKVDYTYGKILFDSGVYELGAYGYLRIISKQFTGPSGETELWQYKYGPTNSDWDTDDADPDHYVTLANIRASVGKFNLYNYLPSYPKTKIMNPGGDSTIYYYFDGQNLDNNPYRNRDFVGQLDSVRIYDNLLRCTYRYYYDRCSTNVAREFWDDFNGEYRNYYENRKIGELQILGDAKYFKEYNSFSTYGIPRIIGDHSKVNLVSWGVDPLGNNTPTTGNFIIQHTPGYTNSIRAEIYDYMWENDINYKTAHLLSLVKEHSIGKFNYQEVVRETYGYDEYALSNWSPSGAAPTQWNKEHNQFRGNCTSVRMLNDYALPRELVFYYDSSGNVTNQYISINDSLIRRRVEYKYSGQYERAYPSHVTIDPESTNYEGLNLSDSMTYSFDSGLLTYYIDNNGNSTNFVYDKLGRISIIRYPESGYGNGAEITYSSTTGGDSTWYEVTRRDRLIGDGIRPTRYTRCKYFVDAKNRICQIQNIDEDSLQTIVTTTKYWQDNLTRIQTKPKRIPRIYPGDTYYVPPSGANLDSIKYSYDALGRLDTTDCTFVDYPTIRHITTKEYNSNEVVSKNEDQNPTKAILGARNTLKQISWGNNYSKSITIEYNCLDRPVQSIDGDGNVYQYAYDRNSNLVKTTNPDRNGIDTLIYNPQGDLIFKQDPVRSQDTAYGWIYNKYDKAGRLTETGLLGLPGTCVPEPHEYTMTSSLMVNISCPIKETTFVATFTEYAYCEAFFNVPGNPPPLNEEFNTNIVMLRGCRCFGVLDLDNNEEEVWTTRNSGNGYAHLRAGHHYKVRLVDTTDPQPGWYSIGEIQYNDIRETDCVPNYDYLQNWQKRYYYDIYPSGTSTPQFDNNPLGNLTQTKSRSDSASEVDSTLYLYDRRNRMVEKRIFISGIPQKTLRYVYNSGNLVDSIIYPDSSIVSYEYNGYGLTSKVGDNVYADKYATIAYTPTQNIDSIFLGRGPTQVINYSYNPQRDWITAINNVDNISPYDTGNGDHYAETITYYSGGYDGGNNNIGFRNGNPASVRHRNSHGLDRLFHCNYDDRDRLLNAFVSSGSVYNETFNYGSYNNGRIFQYTRGAIAHQYNYNASTNQINYITGWSQSPGNYQYNHNGSITSDAEKSMVMQLDYRELPIRITHNNEQLDFKYDANNNRVRKAYATTGFGDTTYYLWSGDQIICEYYGNGSLKNNYIYAGKKMMAHRNFVSTSPCLSAQPCGADRAGFCIVDSGNCDIYDHLCEWIPGDASGDGYRNGADVNFLVAYFHGTGRAPFPLSRGDMNFDGLVNGGDVLYLVAYFKGTRPCPSCTYFSCGVLYFHLNDHLGSTRVLVDSTGRMYAGYDYSVTGLKTGQNWVYRGTSKQFLGKEFDEEMGINLSYLNARYYDPKTFTFMSLEPMIAKSEIAAANSINPALLVNSPYSYANNNPIKQVDKNGLWVDYIPDAVSLYLDAKEFCEHPSWANGGYLALDIVMAATPFVPAVGVVRHTDEIKSILNIGKDAAAYSRSAGKIGEEIAEQGLKAAERDYVKEVVRGSCRFDFIVGSREIWEVKNINWSAKSYAHSSGISSRLWAIEKQLTKYSNNLLDGETLVLNITKPQNKNIEHKLETITAKLQVELKWLK